MSTSTPTDTRGLAGVVAGDTAVCAVNQTQLIYRGFEIADLAENATFEEVAHLLLVGHKPTSHELAAFRDELNALRPLPDGVRDCLDAIKRSPITAEPMSVLRTIVSMMGCYAIEDEFNEAGAPLLKAKRLTARIPAAIGAIHRVLNGMEPVEPRNDLSHAGNLLWAITGKDPDPLHEKVMDVSLILYAEHDFNASTFTGRVIASTLSDMHSAVTGAIGALKGRLHGGANEKAMELLMDVDKHIAAGGTVESYMADAFQRHRKLMGFGHRVYKHGDHRAPILRGLGLQIAEKRGPEYTKWFEIGDKIQEIMEKEKNIFPNVDFPCGMTYYTMDIPVPLYTPIFVASRVTGWCAHIMEQLQNNRLYRPLANYTGPALKRWIDNFGDPR